MSTDDADAADVVIVSYECAALLPRAIGSVRAWPSCGRVIVVDNASCDRSLSVAEALADVVHSCTENLGFGAAQNIGAAVVDTPYFLALNPDAVVVAEGLTAGLEVLEEDPRIAMVQGIIRSSSNGAAERSWGPEPGLAELVSHRFRLRSLLGDAALQRAAALVGKSYYRDRGGADTETEFLAAVAPLVRTAAFRNVGGFDERFFLYGEDVDLGLRLRAGGWVLRMLDAEWAVHVGGGSSVGHSDLRETHWRAGHARLAEQHWTGWRLAAARMLVGRPDRG